MYFNLKAIIIIFILGFFHGYMEKNLKKNKKQHIYMYRIQDLRVKNFNLIRLVETSYRYFLRFAMILFFDFINKSNFNFCLSFIII